ncbi:MAG TPA: glycosyltransferase [Terriglobia bacterium]|nr:glycosyltransferase [Terriglobia bacterium]
MTSSVDHKTALVHHWLVTQRGGESVFDAILEIFPGAPVVTLVYDHRWSSSSLRERTVRTSFIQKFPRAHRWYPYYLPLFPWATQCLDLSDFQIVISSDAATMKGVRTAPGALHICYCHTPMRYVWSGYDDYARQLGTLGSVLFPWMAERLRRWDFAAAQRVTRFVANSQAVASRIRRFYGRESTVIYPPVDTEYFVPDPQARRSGDYYVLVSQLVPYKRADLVIDAFNRTGRRLVVIGEGSERRNLEHQAGPNVKILGPQPRDVIRRHLQSCRGFIFAGEEDFGIVMAEALACGAPVLAFGRGGAAEIVEDGKTGILFEEQRVDSLLEGLSKLEGIRFDPDELRHSVLRFSRDRFVNEFSRLVQEELRDHGLLAPTLEQGGDVLKGGLLRPASGLAEMLSVQVRK